MKPRYRYNWKTGEWDYVVRFDTGYKLPVVANTNNPCYRSTISSAEYKRAQRLMNYKMLAMAGRQALGIQSHDI